MLRVTNDPGKNIFTAEPGKRIKAYTICTRYQDHEIIGWTPVKLEEQFAAVEDVSDTDILHWVMELGAIYPERNLNVCLFPVECQPDGTWKLFHSYSIGMPRKS